MDPEIKTELDTISKGQYEEMNASVFICNRNQDAMQLEAFPDNSISENLFKILFISIFLL